MHHLRSPASVSLQSEVFCIFISLPQLFKTLLYPILTIIFEQDTIPFMIYFIGHTLFPQFKKYFNKTESLLFNSYGGLSGKRGNFPGEPGMHQCPQRQSEGKCQLTCNIPYT